jgi:dephospho-CoA kinase
MNKFYVTGVSGTGKTTIARELHSRGIKTINIDGVSNLCCWKNKSDGKRVDYEAILDEKFINSHDWVCDAEMLKKIINSDDRIVVFGIASNQNDYLSFFDKVILLQCKPETFIKRVSERKDNDFGKDKTAQQYILAMFTKFENDLLEKGAVSVNADGSIEDVAQAVIKLIEG